MTANPPESPRLTTSVDTLYPFTSFESGIFRVFYVAKFEDAVHVLHCFQKKTQKTAKSDIDLGSKRYAELVKEQKR
jgi:phage-related protein